MGVGIYAVPSGAASVPRGQGHTLGGDVRGSRRAAENGLYVA